MNDQTADGHSTPAAPATPASPAGARASRRGFLVTTGLMIGAAGGGVALGLSGRQSASGPRIARVPAELAEAADAERALIAAVDATLATARGRERTTLRLLRADHAAHLAAVLAATADTIYPAVTSSAPSSAASRPTSALSPAGVRSAEQRAAGTAAARALRLSGPNAALLASIAASEAAHVELLT